MEKNSIHLSDIHRILFGDAPTVFLLEVFIRTIITYFILLTVTRWLGKRMTGQLSITEMAVMLTLGAIVSVAMQVPESGIMMAVLVLTCTLTFERGLAWLEFKNKKVERFSQGEVGILVKDGIIQRKEMDKTALSKQQLFAELRSKGIYNLGMIKRVYLEASGIFSIFKTDSENPGLPTLPPDDPEMLKKYHTTTLVSCIHCGYTRQPDKGINICVDCGHQDWTSAILIKNS